MNLIEHIELLARRQPTAIALADCDKEGRELRHITYGELPQKIAEVAQGLSELGLRTGDKVALSMPMTIDQLVVAWAAWSTGIITVPLDTKRDTPALTDFKLKHSGAKTILHNLPPFTQEPAPAWVHTTSNLALILFTSGTTAYPKGVQLTLENLSVNASSIMKWLQMNASDTFLVQLPLHHINSTTFCLATLLAGGKIAIPPQYSNSGFWKQVAESGATLTSVVQSIVFDQLRRVDEYMAARDGVKLSRIQIGSAPVVAHAAQEFVRTFTIPLFQGYGQTETALRVTGVPMDLPPPLYEQLLAENSIGVSMPWAEVGVIDTEGNLLGEKQEGEIVVKGPAVMQGYIGTTEGFRNEYFLTGDIGWYQVIEGRKFFFLKGRNKEIIIKGGINISPVAVENALQKISSEIAQVYVFPFEDKRYGEVPAAAVCWKPDIDAVAAMRRLKIRLLCNRKELSMYEVPDFLASINPAELPLTSTGKVQRVLLKKQLLPERFESRFDLMSSKNVRFVILEPHSMWFEASRALYNHCWQPMIVDAPAYTRYLTSHYTLAAIENEKIIGQISFDCKPNTIECLSICSASYIPKLVPALHHIPQPEEVTEYLFAGKDGIYNFHAKLGARFVELMPNGRPEDVSAAGYVMRLRYSVPTSPLMIPVDAPISHQLIFVILLLAQDLGFAEVDALSRPGGLATYLASHV